MKPSKIDLVRKMFQKKNICTVLELCEELEIGARMIRKYIKDLGGLTSINCKGKYHILPEGKDFQENGLLYLDEKTFFKGGNQLDALCHLIEISDAGLGFRDLENLVRTSTHSQMPKLHDDLRVQRRRARGQNWYVYFSPNKERCAAQKALRFPPLQEAKNTSENIIEQGLNDPASARTEVELVVAVLSTFLKQENPTEKSIYSALRAKGYQLSKTKVREIFTQNELCSKKKP